MTQTRVRDLKAPKLPARPPLEFEASTDETLTKRADTLRARLRMLTDHQRTLNRMAKEAEALMAEDADYLQAINRERRWRDELAGRANVAAGRRG